MAFARKKTAPRGKKNRPHLWSRRLGMEQLECRALLSGVSFSSGILAIAGTSGNDTVRVLDAGSTVQVNFNSDPVKTFSRSAILSVRFTGGAGNDYLQVTGNMPVKASGGDGNDTLFGGSGDDLLDGGNGNDELHGCEGKNTLLGGNGDDYLNGGSNQDVMHGGAGNDSLFSWEGNDILYGDAGNDLFWGWNGNDWIDGGAGNDSIYSQNDDDYIRGGDGNDIIEASDGNDTVYGGNGNDAIQGSYGNDYLSGDAGADTIDGYMGNDTIHGGNGDDKISGGGDNDWINGGNGNDLIAGDIGYSQYNTGTPGNDTIYGGTGNDTLNGEGGNDTLYGDAGNDVFYGGTEGDCLWGGNGNDNLYGGGGEDQLHGDDGNDILRGDGKGEVMGGYDTLWGGKGNDTLYGDGGSDKLYGDDGNDVLWGDIGNNDEYVWWSDTLWGGKGNDTLNGEAGSDVLHGDAGNDNLFGGSTGDFLYGDTGVDKLYGGSGDDNLVGGLGNDYLYGEGGNDYLYCDSGFDSLSGGDGLDTYKRNMGPAGLSLSGSYPEDQFNPDEWAVKDGNDTVAACYNDIFQTESRGCFFYAALSAVSFAGKDLAAGIRHTTKTSDYYITFYKRQGNQFVAVVGHATFDGSWTDHDIPPEKGSSPDYWPTIYQRAYEDVFGQITESGGWFPAALECLTGKSNQAIPGSTGSNNAKKPNGGASDYNTMIAALNSKGAALEASTVEGYGKKHLLDVETGLVGDHSYTITKVESSLAGGTWVTLRNPWGKDTDKLYYDFNGDGKLSASEQLQYNKALSGADDGILRIKWEKFAKYFDYYAIGLV